MTIKVVTCPETARLEQIAYTNDPDGIRIVRCSGTSAAEVQCSHRCAAPIDARLQIVTVRNRQIEAAATTSHLLRRVLRQRCV